MAGKKKIVPQLHVVFDTSVLYTQVAYDLMRSDVRQYITANSNHLDLNVFWYLPSVVVDERRYQMQCKAFEFLPTISKLEKLLGHNLNITEDILSTRVNDAINKQLNDLKLDVLKMDTTKIDWESLISRAVCRNPPFKPGDHEKGFRDALIAETFLQLVAKSPVTPSICRLAIVTNDDLLKKYISAATSGAKNIRVLSDMNELESLINTVASEVTEEFVTELKEKASKLFFQKEDTACLYSREKISEKILESYGKELKSIPTEGLYRENGTWWINEPVFIKKDHQRTYWVTAIDIDSKLYKYENYEATPQNALLSAVPSGFSTAYSSAFAGMMANALSSKSIEQNYLSAVPSDLPIALSSIKKMDVAKGQSKFEVHWNANVTQSKKLTAPRIDKILFINTKWNNE